MPRQGYQPPGRSWPVLRPGGGNPSDPRRAWPPNAARPDDRGTAGPGHRDTGPGRNARDNAGGHSRLADLLLLPQRISGPNTDRRTIRPRPGSELLSVIGPTHEIANRGLGPRSRMRGALGRVVSHSSIPPVSSWQAHGTRCQGAGRPPAMTRRSLRPTRARQTRGTGTTSSRVAGGHAPPITAKRARQPEPARPSGAGRNRKAFQSHGRNHQNPDTSARPATTPGAGHQANDGVASPDPFTTTNAPG